MKRLVYFIYLSLLLVILVSCQKETVMPDAVAKPDSATANNKIGGCKNYFYVTKTGLKQLGTARPQIVVVGFAPALSRTDQETILSRYSLYDSIAGEAFMDSGVLTLVQLQAGATCSDVDNFMRSLQSRSGVKFALPTFDPQPAQQGIFEWVGLTNEFIVTLKNAKDYPHLVKLTRLTNTHIVTNLDDVTYIVSADKHSAGNALDMSSVFNLSPKIVAADPNLLFQYLPFDGTRKTPERTSRQKFSKQLTAQL